jgi:anti-sigma factor RsiW
MVEALLPDMVDGTLSPAEKLVVDRHVATCVSCARELEEAQRGAAWLSMLKSHAPEPPVALLEKILADTTGVENAPVAARTVPVRAIVTAPVDQWQAQEWAVQPMAKVSWWASIRQRVVDTLRVEPGHTNFHPRLVMTAAMAFFSIALSLNMSGIKLHDLKAEDFTPSGVRRAVADASASAERRFQNLRVVYQMESRVNELRSDNSGADDRNFGQAPAAAPSQDGNQNAQPEPSQNPPADHQPSGQDQKQPKGSSHLRFPNPVDSRRRGITEVIS